MLQPLERVIDEPNLIVLVAHTATVGATLSRHSRQRERHTADGEFSRTKLRIKIFSTHRLQGKRSKIGGDLQRVNSTTAGRYGMHVQLRKVL